VVHRGATLGFGFSSFTTDIDTSGPASDRPLTAYFAHEFEVSDAGQVQSLVLDTVANDGVVVYVNGTEVARHKMRVGDVTHFTYAPSARNVSRADAAPVMVDVPVCMAGGLSTGSMASVDRRLAAQPLSLASCRPTRNSSLTTAGCRRL